MEKLNINELPSPCYLIDINLLENNLKILKGIENETGAKILLASKAFSMYSTFKLIGKYLSGVTSSSLYEARLGYEEMGKEIHIFSPAYREGEFDQIMKYSDHIIFNSFNQWKKYKNKIKSYKKKKIECGLRINPQYSEIKEDIYNPCAKYSRLGITLENFEEDIDGIDGLHFHTMCEQNSDVLENTLKHVEEKFGQYMEKVKWINFGGGHHITRKGYDIRKLIYCINYMQDKYGVQVYIEPGEAVALNCGFLICTVLDIIHNEKDIAILDTSAECHMPDVLEMPYKPQVAGAEDEGKYEYNYRLGGITCLAGDIIGDYSFKHPLKIGDKIIFKDMAIYTMVKNNTFNGVGLPSIVKYDKNSGAEIVRKFGYEDFKSRL